MENSLLFLYFGDDEGYFRSLQGEFKRHAKMEISFKKMYESSESKIQSLFLNVHRLHPTCVFIDFSNKTNDYLHLIKLLASTPWEKAPIIVGLMDYLLPPEMMSECLLNGAQLGFVKGTETYDVVHHIVHLISPTGMAPHGFAKAKLKEEHEVGLPARVVSLHEEGLHVETDFSFMPKEVLHMNHYWLEKSIIPSREMTLLGVQHVDLFTQLKNALYLSFHFLDRPTAPEAEEVATERETEMDYYKKKYEKWLSGKQGLYPEAKSKVLVIDFNFRLYDGQPRTEKRPYVVRCLPTMNNIKGELKRFRPHILAIELDADPNVPENTLYKFEEMVRMMKSDLPDVTPFIIVTRCPPNSMELRRRLKYDNIIASAGELPVEVLMSMTEMMEKKGADPRMRGFVELKRTYLKSSDEASFAEIMRTIILTQLTESDAIFQSAEKFPVGCHLHLTSPVDMYLYVCSSKTLGSIHEYKGFIHGISENQKNELRRYINNVFFRVGDSQKAAELEEFKQLNEQKLKEKLEKASGE